LTKPELANQLQTDN